MQQLFTLFKRINHTPEDSLRGRVLGVIQREETVRRVRQGRIALGAVLLSGSAFLGSLIWAGVTVVQSEFWTLLSLLFSDLGIILSSLQDFGYSLLETIPVLPLALILIPFFLFSLSLSFWSSLGERREGKMFHSSLFAH